MVALALMFCQNYIVAAHSVMRHFYFEKVSVFRCSVIDTDENAFMDYDDKFYKTFDILKLLSIVDDGVYAMSVKSVNIHGFRTYTEWLAQDNMSSYSTTLRVYFDKLNVWQLQWLEATDAEEAQKSILHNLKCLCCTTAFTI